MSVTTYEVMVLPFAKRDVYGIWKDLSVVNPLAADNMLARIDKRVLSLREFPERGAQRDELLPGLRMLVEARYLIFYRVEGNTVQILRVIHGAQDMNQEFS